MQNFVNTSYIRFVKRLYVALHTTLVVLILLGSGTLYIAFRPDGLQLLTTYVFQPLGIHYSRSSGSLIEGFTLYDLHSERLRAKELSLTYRLDTILEGNHVIDHIRIDGLQIHLDDFMEDSSSPWPFPTFALREVSLTNLQLISDYPVELDLYAKDGSYDGDNLSFRTLRTSIKSSYASGAIHGRVKNNSLTGTAILYPNAQKLESSSGRFTTLPPKLLLSIQELSDQQVKLSTRIDTLTLHHDPTLQALGIELSMAYRYDDDYLDVGADYLLKREHESAKIHQNLRYTFDHTLHTQIKGTIVESTYPLPANTFHAEAATTSEGIRGSFDFDGTRLLLSSTDYDRFDWRVTSTHPNLNFIPGLPPLLRSSAFELRAQGAYLLGANDLNGHLQWRHAEGNFEGSFSSYEGVHQLDGYLHFTPQGVVQTQTLFPLPEQMHLALFAETNSTTLNLSGEGVALSLASHNGNLKGFGNIHATAFTLTGAHHDTSLSLDLETHTPSLLTTLTALRPIHLEKGEWFDGEAHTQTHLTYDTSLHASGTISLPWYAITLDSQRSYGGTDNTLSYRLEGDEIVIDHYRADVVNHILTSAKPARLHLAPNSRLVIDEFWIYDTLALKGIVSMEDLTAALHLHSDRFTYQGPEGEAHAKVDITFTRDAEALHALEGSVLIQDALITYLPLQQFKVTDDDIIIVQDVRPPSNTKMRMNLHVTSVEPIHFKTKELNLKLIPDLTFWKDPQGPIQILGLVTIPSGSAMTSGKTFELSPSHLYFGGETPLNPYLDFTLSHEVDYKKLLIYITHRLDSPIFLFASDPVMSQNDIMSYLLFGSPANVSLNSDRSSTTARADATNFMLGAGLKELIGGATKIQLDTMNILTTEKGGMGFEVGTHINKDLRVLYKNDTVSSILVQYRLNRWLRLDADVHELGQGINAIYVKDFRDFLPHHELKKK